MTLSTNNPPLLSPKEFAEFQPEEFHLYVKGLFVAPRPRKSPKEREPAKVVFSRTKTGKLAVRTARKPVRWITEAEVREACSAFQIPANEMFLLLKAREFSIVANRADGEELCGFVREIPW